MRIITFRLLFLFIIAGVISCVKENSGNNNKGLIQLTSVKIGTYTLSPDNIVKNVPGDQPVVLTFSSAADTTSLKKNITLAYTGGAGIPYSYTAANNSTVITITPIFHPSEFRHYYTFGFLIFKGAEWRDFPGCTVSIHNYSGYYGD